MDGNTRRIFPGLRRHRPTSQTWSPVGSAAVPARSESGASIAGRGDQARDAGDWSKASVLYGEALRVDPSLVHIWVQCGHALKETGQLANALDAYRTALQLDPTIADTHLQLGHALKLSHQFDEAAKAYLESYKLDPTRQDTRSELTRFGWSSAEIALASGVYDPATVNSAYAGDREGPYRLDRRVPVGYVQNNPDVSSLLRKGLIDSPEQHYRLYGYREGRDIIQSLAETPPSHAFVLCPSHFKRCGIGEHARYLADSLEGLGLTVHRIRTTSELTAYDAHHLRNGVLIVNHGPGLFDGYNPELSEGESTSDLLVALRHYFVVHGLRPIIYMHSLLDRDNQVMFGRQELLLEAPIPVVTTIEAAARNFHIPHVEHGVQPIACASDLPKPVRRGRDFPIIGFFGFLQFGGKDFEAVANVVTALKARLVGSVASRDKEDIKRLASFFESRRVACDLATGWVSDVELARKLSDADFIYLPQKDHDHWNNSGTARFAANFDCPVILPPHQPFLDLRDVAIFANENDIPAVISYLRNDINYNVAVERVRRYRTMTSMRRTAACLAYELPRIVQDQAEHGFAGLNATSAVQLASVSRRIAQARTSDASPDGNPEADDISVADRPTYIAQLQRHSTVAPVVAFPIAEPVQIWRRHYRIEEFCYLNRQDLIFAVYRMLQKRDPTYYEYRRRLGQLQLNDRGWVCMSGIGTWLVDTLLQLLGEGVSDLAGPAIELSGFGQTISQRSLAKDRTALAAQIIAAFGGATDIATRLPPSKRFILDPTFDRNLISLLCLPADLVGDALRQVCSSIGAEAVDFQAIGNLPTIRQRYVAVMSQLADVSMHSTSIFLMERPFVQPINPWRTIYAMSEFVVHEGDAFITSLVRALLKRDPLVIEAFEFTRILRDRGKFGLVRHVAQTLACNATVIDIDSPDRIAWHLNDANVSQIDTLFADVRSAAGNWDIHNAFLEADRNYSRLWLRLKSQKDQWWGQCGQRTVNLAL
jgi:tetratricopeptide (TPR) repeat protein